MIPATWTLTFAVRRGKQRVGVLVLADETGAKQSRTMRLRVVVDAASARVRNKLDWKSRRRMMLREKRIWVLDEVW